jgi:hypothetical protein
MRKRRLSSSKQNLFTFKFLLTAYSLNNVLVGFDRSLNTSIERILMFVEHVVNLSEDTTWLIFSLWHDWALSTYWIITCLLETSSGHQTCNVKNQKWFEMRQVRLRVYILYSRNYKKALGNFTVLGAESGSTIYGVLMCQEKRQEPERNFGLNLTLAQ